MNYPHSYCSGCIVKCKERKRVGFSVEPKDVVLDGVTWNAPSTTILDLGREVVIMFWVTCKRCREQFSVSQYGEVFCPHCGHRHRVDSSTNIWG